MLKSIDIPQYWVNPYRLLDCFPLARFTIITRKIYAPYGESVKKKMKINIKVTDNVDTHVDIRRRKTPRDKRENTIQCERVPCTNFLVYTCKLIFLNNSKTKVCNSWYN